MMIEKNETSIIFFRSAWNVPIWQIKMLYMTIYVYIIDVKLHYLLIIYWSVGYGIP